MSYPLALALSALVGYVSLSQEILWFRVISYATGGSPFAFAHLLGAFLGGLALGALLARRISRAERRDPAALLASVLLVSAAAYHVSIPATGRVFEWSEEGGLLAAYVAVGLISLLGGVLFPLLCHFGIPTGAHVGRSLSGIYFANILGSTLGPLVTTFVLMDLWPLSTLVVYVTVLLLFAAVAASWVLKASPRLRAFVLAAACTYGSIAIATRARHFEGLLERLHFKTDRAHHPPYSRVIETRSGIVVVEPDTDEEVVYGGGLYDGKFNIDPVSDTNGIRRAYMMAALHPNPVEVLQIGLATGSWARVLANHPKVLRETVVEINPGYLALIRDNPTNRTLLNDPKVVIDIDDGRRWLNRHPDTRFDFVLMNTTYHWRSQVSGLLSVEFLELVRRHLKPGGVFYYNTTGSEDVRYTAAQVFPYTTAYNNFVAASDSPFGLSREEKLSNLNAFESAGRPTFSAETPASEAALLAMADAVLPDMNARYQAETSLWKITDDNMASEFKAQEAIFDPEKTWARAFRVLYRAR